MKRNKRFIVGIHNYCDYWCARCAFTRRCRNFALEPELRRKAEGGPDVERDATNQDFWNHLAEKLREKAASGAAPEWCEEVDLDDLAPDPDYEARERALDEALEAHPLTALSRDYMLRVHRWLKDADADLKDVARALIESAGAPFDTTDYEEQAREIGELIDVVAWYHTLIPPKLARATRGLLEGGTEGEDRGLVEQCRLEDANGSGKVALVAVERSMAAWLRLRDILPKQEGEILGMLVLLSRLQKGVHAALPGAVSFRRPGFEGGSLLADDEDDEG